MSSQGWSDALNSAFSLFTALPEAAREEARKELLELGKQALQIQEELAPKKTGFLQQGLTVVAAMQALRVRIGYPNLKGSRNKRFYAIVMEYGRKAKTVTVIRGTTANLNIAKGGYSKTFSIRKRQAAGLKIRDSYDLDVTALPARPFVHVEDRIDDLADRLTAKFWDQALAAAGKNS